MGSWRVYIAPIVSEDSGNVEFKDYIEVTDRVVSNTIGTVKKRTESNEFDIGIAINNSLRFELINDSGAFSEVGTISSIFPYRRQGSKVKLTYLFGEYEPICGVAIAGVDVLGPEIDSFEGFLTEKDITQNIVDDTISFTVLGKESIFDSYDMDLNGTTSASSIALALYNILNLSAITDVFDLDFTNINPAFNPLLSEINTDLTLEYLTERTTREAVNVLLEASASVMYIENDTIYVTDRSANEGIKYEFFGEAAPFGIENIQNISDFKSGYSRTFNFWKWADTDLIKRDTSSIATNGLLKHEDLDFDAVNIESARNDLLSAYNLEFANPVPELKLTTPVNIETIGLKLFDKVTIDYPAVPVAIGLGNLPVWNTGSMIWQDENTYDSEQPFFSWPDGRFNMEITPNREWKIIGIDVTSKKDLTTIELREVFSV